MNDCRSGEQIKSIRMRLGITTRDVEEHSRKIARSKGNEDYSISNARLTQIENSDSTPSIHKLYSLSTILRVKFTELARLYGVDLDGIPCERMGIGIKQTHLTTLEICDPSQAVPFPIRLEESFHIQTTSLLSRIVSVWGEVPIALIRRLDTRSSQYGFIGLSDFTMFPMLRPGSFVQIDDRSKKICTFPWRSEYERPIYFLELRDGYACGWCELQDTELSLISHPLSPCKIRRFIVGKEAEVIGRVTAMAMRVVDLGEDSSTRLGITPVAK